MAIIYTIIEQYIDNFLVNILTISGKYLENIWTILGTYLGDICTKFGDIHTIFGQCRHCFGQCFISFDNIYAIWARIWIKFMPYLFENYQIFRHCLAPSG